MDCNEPYTIKVTVTNKFKTPVGITGQKSNSNGKVIYGPYSIPGAREPEETETFKLNNTDELLEIFLNSKSDQPTTYPYQIIVGLRAKAKFELDGEPVEPKNARIGAEYHDDGFYTGAIWTIKEEDKEKIWKLTIKEYEFDPKEDNVIIGDVEH